MICLICRRAEISSDLISVRFARDEMNLTVNRVRAEVCPDCGEGYLDEGIARSLLRYAEAIYLTGSIENVYDYEELIARY
jgi:YgiT-type zinc finger domain-containing protein